MAGRGAKGRSGDRGHDSLDEEAAFVPRRRHRGGDDDDDDEEEEEEEEEEDSVPPGLERIRSKELAAKHRLLVEQARQRDEEASGDDDEEEEDVIDLRGVGQKAAVGMRLQVSYMERSGKSLLPVAYRGSVASVDMRKGLRVKLDGYVRREWVTDEDEWTWLPEHDSAPLPHQLELMRTMVDDGADKGDPSCKGAESKAEGKVDKPKGTGKAAAKGEGVSAPSRAIAEGASSSAAPPPMLFAALVRLRLRGEPIVELPPSLTAKPRRSSAVRPLPNTLIGIAAAAAHEERERIAQTRPPKDLAKLPTSPKVPASPAAAGKAAAPGAKHADEAGEYSQAHPEKETEKALRPASSVKSKGKGKAAADKGERKPEKGAKGGGGGQMVSSSNVNGGSSHDDDNGAGGVADGQMTTVTIANGPHTGKECKVLHVGNGWVKLQLPSGTVMHMRKWDLHGDVPLKLRSPGSKTSSKPSRTFEADVEAASKAPSQKSKRDRSDGRQTEVDGTADASTEKAASVNDSHSGVTAAAADQQPRKKKGSSKEVARETKRAAAAAAAAVAVAAAEEEEEEAAAEAGREVPEKKPSKKRSLEACELQQNGFTLGTHVWARWSGIKFSRGVISKLLTSSKWVLVTFESEQSQWVTSREMVLDEEVRPESLAEGTEVIAAWEDDDKFYKGRIMGKSSNGRYRVRYDDWDDALVMIEGIRLLPEGFGKKKRLSQAEGSKEEGSISSKSEGDAKAGGSSSVSSGALAAVSASNGDAVPPPTAEKTTASGICGSAANGASEASVGSAKSCVKAEVTGTAPVNGRLTAQGDGGRMARFVRNAREQLWAKEPARFDQLTKLLARGGSMRLPAFPDDPSATREEVAFEAELVALLESYSTLMSELRALLSYGGPASPSSVTAPAPASAPAPSAAEAQPMAVSNTAASGGGDCAEGAAEHLHAPTGVIDVAASTESQSATTRASSSAGGVDKGAQGRGVRELHKLLQEFGEGSSVGVEIASKTRHRGAAAEASASNASSSAEGGVAGGAGAMPLKKRPRE